LQVAGRISSSLPQGSQLLKLKALIGTRERRRTGEGREQEQGELLCTLSRTEVLCSSHAGGGSAASARRRRAGSSWSWVPSSLRPWLVVADEGGDCSGGRPAAATSDGTGRAREGCRTIGCASGGVTRGELGLGQ
jgi:hypothetical protein